MAITKARRIINSVKEDLGGTLVFNDPINDGGRSIKVWGWDKNDYTIAMIALKAAGMRVVRVRTPGNYRCPPITRLHVYEN